MRKIIVFLLFAGIASPTVAAIECPLQPANGVTWNKKEFACIQQRERELEQERQARAAQRRYDQKNMPWEEYAKKYSLSDVPNYDTETYSDYLSARNFINREVQIQRQQDYFFRPR